MKLRIYIFLTVLLGIAGEVYGGEGLRIYLPREKAIKGENISLGSVGIIRGDEKLISHAEEVSLGKFRVTGQQIVIDKQTILSRLASAGIDNKDVSFSGSEKVTLNRDEKIIPGTRIIEVARNLVEEQLSSYSMSSIKVVGKCQDYVLAEGVGDVELLAEMSRYNTTSKMNIIVKIMEEGIEIGNRQVSFALRYNNRKVVASINIPSGAVISSDNTSIETYESSSPAKSELVVPYGLVAKRDIRAGSTLDDRLVGPLQAAVAVKRKQIVVVKIDAGALSVSSLGEALSDGKPGEYIKVKMGTDKTARTIIAQVTNDGTLKPIF